MADDSAGPARTANRIAIVIPVLNEAAFIGDCLTALLPQATALQTDMMVLDGGSTDGTQAIVTALAASHPRLRLINNPRRLQSAALNLAARQAAPDVGVLVRADAHADYPADFVARVTAVLRDQQATSVVVPMITRGTSAMQRAIAAVQNSRLGNGGSAHRVGGHSGWVEHGHHAAFDRAFFMTLGGYNAAFSHNEDAELDVRAVRAGGRIWMCGDAAITYFPRRTLGALARQYMRHGSGRARTLLLHRLRPRPRQMAAPAILAMVVLCLLMAPIAPWLLLGPLFYAGACSVWAIAACVQARDPALLAMAPAAMIVHLAWAAGFYQRCLQELVKMGRERAATRLAGGPLPGEAP